MYKALTFIFSFCSLYADGPRWDEHYEEAYQLIYGGIHEITPSVCIMGDVKKYKLDKDAIYDLLKSTLLEKEIPVAQEQAEPPISLEILILAKDGALFMEASLRAQAYLVASRIPVSSLIWKKSILLEDSPGVDMKEVVYSKIDAFLSEVLSKVLQHRQ